MRSVSESIRRCALITVSRDAPLARLRHRLDPRLIAVAVAADEVTRQLCASASKGTRPNESAEHLVALGRPRDARLFQKALERADYDQLGVLLGAPRCCVDFFNEAVVRGHAIDTTWAMAARSHHTTTADRELTVNGWRETNIMWRALGIRAVPHLPCSFDCSESAALGRRMLDLGRVSGLRRHVDTIECVLAWPVEWSAFAGVTHVTAPLVTVAVQTHATPERYVVRRDPAQPALNGAARRDSSDHRYAAQNGFFTIRGMEAAHRPIAECVSRVLGAQEHATVLDLGCGNGALLTTICDLRTGVEPLGMEIDAECLEGAQVRLAERGGTAIAGDMFESAEIWRRPGRYDVVLLMVARLLEVSAARRGQLLKRISAHAARLIVYAYDDELLRHHGSLGELARRAELRLANWDGRSSVCEAITEHAADLVGACC